MKPPPEPATNLSGTEFCGGPCRYAEASRLVGTSNHSPDFDQKKAWSSPMLGTWLNPRSAWSAVRIETSCSGEGPPNTTPMRASWPPDRRPTAPVIPSAPRSLNVRSLPSKTPIAALTLAVGRVQIRDCKHQANEARGGLDPH